MRHAMSLLVIADCRRGTDMRATQTNAHFSANGQQEMGDRIHVDWGWLYPAMAEPKGRASTRFESMAMIQRPFGVISSARGNNTRRLRVEERFGYFVTAWNSPSTRQLLRFYPVLQFRIPDLERGHHPCPGNKT